MSDAREPSTGIVYNENPASGSSSEQEQQPSAGVVYNEYPSFDEFGSYSTGAMLDFFGADPEDLGWQERALCAQTDPEAFFPEKGGSTREAKKVCRSCEVRAECLEYALTHDERFGIWGGLSERERRRLRREAG